MLLLALFFAGITAVLADDEDKQQQQIMDVGKCKYIDYQQLKDNEVNMIAKLIAEPSTWAVKFAAITEESRMRLNSMVFNVEVEKKTAGFIQKITHLKFAWQLLGGKSGEKSQQEKVTAFSQDFLKSALPYADPNGKDAKIEMKYYFLKKDTLTLQRHGSPKKYEYIYIYKCTNDDRVAKPNIDARYVIFSEGDLNTEEVKDVAKLDEELMQTFGFSNKLVFVI
ncbi:uncharacterized protein LOC128996868 [Macrosteles quadrilineatus]|uniref:uncharacterized protein LOC128996868 n=1 Tax=Macrosteles quadrilineatus TaxID=74068 RepID=UPI0023E1B4A4|nr:uncharacterized protein LOC128996868 [Macrosteles quadrilineatus]XP_054278362.1 uncharacterized protein LOC128996868 [Macrosteles quadrilineatus]